MKGSAGSGKSGFNPCFNGTYSLTVTSADRKYIYKVSFNPCFNGTYSLTKRIKKKGE